MSLPKFETTLPPTEWEKRTGIKVLEAEGWVEGKDYSQPVSLVDFLSLAALSTTELQNNGPLWPITI